MWMAASLLIVGQGVVAYLIHRFIKTFGSYHKQLVEIHNTNVQIMEKQQEVVEKQEAITETLERWKDCA